MAWYASHSFLTYDYGILPELRTTMYVALKLPKLRLETVDARPGKVWNTPGLPPTPQEQ